MKKLTALWLSLLLAFGTLTGCAGQIGIIGGEDILVLPDVQGIAGLGWQGGSLEPYAPGCSIGGDRFGNYEGTLPDGSYHECDLNTRGADKRGAERLVYADDGRIYYTADHYESFEEITE